MRRRSLLALLAAVPLLGRRAAAGRDQDPGRRPDPIPGPPRSPDPDDTRRRFRGWLGH
jgi:hypothetical protein